MLDKVFSLRSYVASLFIEGNDDDEVMSILIRRSSHNADVHRELLLLGAKQAVRTFYTDGRGGSEASPRSEKEERANLTQTERSGRESAKQNRRMFWDSYALYGHKLLRDAKAADLRESIENRQIQVAGGVKAIRFEQAILDQIKTEPNKTCSQFFEPETIDKLRKRFYAK